MQAVLLASSHYLQAVPENSLPSLKAALKAECNASFRRIDRFVQLALLGSARCVRAQGHKLDPDCGIYIASAIGPLSSNIKVQEQMLREGEWPMPFDFINTLGGNAGFYVASNLGLSGPDWFMGSGQTLESALSTALMDLAAGAVDQALVGVVEEVPLPLVAHRQRLKVSVDTLLAEGSHWWWLGPDALADDKRHLALYPYENEAQLAAWLDENATIKMDVALSCHLDPAIAQLVRDRCPQAVDLPVLSMPYHASPEAAWLAARLDEGQTEGLMLIGDGELFHLGA